MKTFTLPDLGEGLQEAEIVSWHVAEGDHVVADQPLLSVETEKAVVEIPSPQAGHIAKLLVQAGDVVPIGAPLVEFEEGEQAADAGAIVGEIENEIEVAEEEAPASLAPGTGRVKAAPAIRALAQRLGVDLAVVAASGPDGAVTKADVERAAATLAAAGPLEPLRGVRRAMAHNMARAHAEVVPTTILDRADVDAWRDDEDPTTRLARAIAAGVAVEPALNAWFDAKAEGRRLNSKIDLGIAMDTPDGLFVPVLRDVANRSADDLRRGLEAMKADVRARTVPPEELRGQTITLSNFGMMAGRYAALVVVPPQVAILGAGRTAPEVLAIDGQAVVRRVMPLSLTFDHRAVTGGEAARFLAAVIADLEKPE